MKVAIFVSLKKVSIAVVEFSGETAVMQTGWNQVLVEMQTLPIFSSGKAFVFFKPSNTSC